ncbi:MAG: hypothetical protein LGR52_04540 [Candidatus Thiosymbion ectosymbiont of Robbea hypermnestra]|nr:hypothetical protein [Candidatus Thiosymbion ectosymbiont of Robbea hypermnestra]
MSMSRRQFLIGISISGGPELERLGFGKEHLSELVLSLAHAVLRSDDNTGLVYGGDPRPGGFTRQLFDLALSEQAPPSDAALEPLRRIYSYLAWPYYLTLTRQDEARMIDACHLLRVRPRDAGFPEIADDCDRRQPMEPPGALIASRCLTRMRELATYGGHPTLEDGPAPPMRARILLGGKPSGYASFMPGLFEEFLISRAPPNDRPAIPVFVIGAFGGAAGQLADALLDEGQGEDPLTMKFQLEQEAAAGRQGLEQLIGGYAAYSHLTKLEDCYLEHRYQMLRAAVRSLRDAITGDDTRTLDNGLTPAENRTLLRSRDRIEIRRLLVRGLQRLSES